MADARPFGRIALFSGSWGEPHDESAVAARAVAGAASRLAAVEVLVPGPAGDRLADGAFDLTAVGTGGPPAADGARWPAPDEALWPAVGPFTLAVVDGMDPAARALAARFLPGVPTVSIVSGSAEGLDPALAVGVGGGAPGGHEVGLHVPVHALAATRRHVGLGFTGYLLVLADRGPSATGEAAPTPLAAWLAARFADRHVLVVENATATVWRARSLRGSVSVDTRTDLWRLMAHARATVDLAPGPLFARECVESLHYGVPVVVPSGGAAARLAALGGGLWYRDEAELLGCVEALDDQRVRDGLGAQGRAVAAEWYDDPDRFVARLRTALNEIEGCTRSGQARE